MKRAGNSDVATMSVETEPRAYKPPTATMKYKGFAERHYDVMKRKSHTTSSAILSASR
jgi:hypothetical protein